MTVVPIDVPAVKREEKELEKKKWQTTSGWQYPGMRPSICNNEHPLKPSPGRIDELTEVRAKSFHTFMYLRVLNRIR